MHTSALGYEKDLFILPSDHPSFFEAGLLGFSGQPADPAEVDRLAASSG